MATTQEREEECLRRMRLDDIPRVMAIENRVYPTPWTAGIFRDCLRVGYSAWVCQRDRELLAYAVMAVAAGEAHILNLAVRPESQGEGLGRMLLEHLLACARREAAERAFLEVRPSNAVAIHLYRSLGFSPIGRRKGYYRSVQGREDALVLARELEPEA